ncbi:Hypothetical protein FKW44_018151 [Caligus rogercresseyi]|uniref:Uncharacterized protein n=1 Tax=Caligus rogercresseyi TaxID=217165 RepID=A0A7T8JX78_CALRO|nr:Hypothetical protein FKW44_018151 [Caligus rogercresseyi]
MRSSNVDVKKKKNVDVKNWRQLKKSEDAKSFTKPHWLKSCQLKDCQSLFTPTRLENPLQ